MDFISNSAVFYLAGHPVALGVVVLLALYFLLKPLSR